MCLQLCARDTDARCLACLGTGDVQTCHAWGYYNLRDAAVQASAINILDTYHETVPLWDFHLKDKDCTHFCNPSGYELWTYMLKEKLFHLQPWLKTLDA